MTRYASMAYFLVVWIITAIGVAGLYHARGNTLFYCTFSGLFPRDGKSSVIRGEVSPTEYKKYGRRIDRKQEKENFP